MRRRWIVAVLASAGLGCGWYPRVSPRDDPSRVPEDRSCGTRVRRQACPRPQPIPDRRSPADSVVDTTGVSPGARL